MDFGVLESFRGGIQSFSITSPFSTIPLAKVLKQGKCVILQYRGIERSSVMQFAMIE